MLNKLFKKTLLLIAILGFIAPVSFIPAAQAGTYATRYAIVEVQTWEVLGEWGWSLIPYDPPDAHLGTVQLWTKVNAYSPDGGDTWRILSYTSWKEEKWLEELLGFSYEVLDIDWYTYRIRIGIILAGSIWRIKFYSTLIPDAYVIFDVKAYAYSWGSTVIGYTPVSSSISNYMNVVGEVNYDQEWVYSIGMWLDGARYPFDPW